MMQMFFAKRFNNVSLLKNNI